MSFQQITLFKDIANNTIGLFTPNSNMKTKSKGDKSHENFNFQQSTVMTSSNQ